KKPSVTKISGILRKSRMGRTKALMIPRRRQAPSKQSIPVYSIPTIFAATNTANVVTNQRKTKSRTTPPYYYFAFWPRRVENRLPFAKAIAEGGILEVAKKSKANATASGKVT